MKKGVILSLIALCLLALPSKAQEPVRSVEYEIGGGGSVAMKQGKSCGGMELKMELRCNIPNSNWDAGINFTIGGTMEGIQYDKKSNFHLDESITYMLPIADYNWRRGEKFSYFVGGGMGMAISRIVDDKDGKLTIMPRAGVEFFNRLRLTADYKWNIQGSYNYLNFSAGFVFGGGKKKVSESMQSHKRFKEHEKAQN